MATKVLMPKLGLTMEEGIIVKWNFASGDTVQKGDILYELETDKMTNEVAADTDGVLHIIHPEGAVVPVIETVGVIADAGEDISAYLGGAPAAAEPEKAVQAAPIAAESGAMPAGKEGGKVWASPKAKLVAAEKGINLSVVKGTGPQGLVVVRDLSGQLAAPKASPMAVKVAADSGIPLESIQKDGRIMKQDVLDRIPVAAPASGNVRRIRMTAMRKAVAKNMTASWTTVPAVTYDMQADVTELAALKKVLEKSGQKISYTDILAKMTACALMAFPLMNSRIDGNEIVLHDYVNLGVAVALEDGLVVPVIAGADKKGIGEISAEIRQLAVMAREGRLTTEEMSGGTFTITNLGMFGMKSFSPIINLPESGILGVNTITETPVVVDGEIVIRPLITLSLTADHRTVDGAVAANFMKRLCELIENPWQLLL